MFHNGPLGVPQSRPNGPFSGRSPAQASRFPPLPDPHAHSGAAAGKDLQIEDLQIEEVDRTGLEPVTFSVSWRRASQLRQRSKAGECSGSARRADEGFWRIHSP